MKQGESTLSLVCNDFSDAVANTAQSLQAITMHQFILNASYDFKNLFPHNARALPYLSFYARVPFNGTRAVEQTMIGTIIGANF
jgi:TorA maturation chaperone TorD